MFQRPGKNAPELNVHVRPRQWLRFPHLHLDLFQHQTKSLVRRWTEMARRRSPFGWWQINIFHFSILNFKQKKKQNKKFHHFAFECVEAWVCRDVHKSHGGHKNSKLDSTEIPN
jgi:hypothetical protein